MMQVLRSKHFRIKKLKGFTLIELLVVIAIIGTLSTVVFTYLKGARSSARDAMRQSDMRQLVSAQGIYFGFNDRYFTAAPPEEGGVPAIYRYLSPLHDPQCPGEACTDYVWVDNRFNILCSDPDLGSLSAGDWFCAYAILEEEPATPGNKVYFCASHKGTKKCELEEEPSVMGSCTCF